MMIQIRKIENANEKQHISRIILEALPDWFGITEFKEQYIKESANQPFFVAYDLGKPIGFLCLKETGKETVELSVMGVLKNYHRKGVGRRLKNQLFNQGTPLCRLRQFKWEDTKIMMLPTVFIYPLASKSLKCFQLCGMSGIRVRYM